MQEITIKPNERLIRGILVSGLLVALTFGGTGIVKVATAQSPNGPPLVLWVALFLWCGMNVCLAIFLCWIIFGVEAMQIGQETLTIQRKLRSLNVGKPRVFFIEEIQQMRLENETRKVKGKSVTRYVITFDYQGRKRVLFPHLSKYRAENLLNGPLHRFVRQP